MSIKKIFSNTQRKDLLILLTFFTFSMAIRLIGVKHGSPLLTHPDEATILHPVFNMTINRTLNPGNFSRPNQILYLLNFFYLNTLSYLRFGQNLAATFPANQLIFFHYSRLLISFIGSLIPFISYKIGEQIKPKFAFASGIVFAIFPAFVEHSLFVTPDVPITLFTLLVIYFTLRYLNKNDERSIFLAIIFAGINTAEKYPGIISLSIVFLGLLINFIKNPAYSFKNNWWVLIKKILIYSLVFTIVIFVIAPYLLIEFEAVIAALIFESGSTHLGADNLGWFGNLIFYIKAFGYRSNIMSIFFIAIGIFTLVKYRNIDSLILFYGALYWIILSKLSLHWERWALPMYITPLFLIAIGMTYFWEIIKTNPKTRLFSIVIIAFISQQLIASLHTPVRMTFTDTRLIALNYCRQNAITPDNSIYEGYSPFLPPDPKNISQQEITNNEDVKYIILSSQMYRRYFNEPSRYEDKILFYENIRKKHVLLKKFEPTPTSTKMLDKIDDIVFYFQRYKQSTSDNRYHGPTIEIYQIVN